MNTKQHQNFALEAADIAEKVLVNFEVENRKDARPRNAIKAARDWANGKIKCGEARKLAFAAHAAAREAKSDAAIFAARAAAHAAATAHVETHLRAVKEYAKKSALSQENITTK